MSPCTCDKFISLPLLPAFEHQLVFAFIICRLAINCTCIFFFHQLAPANFSCTCFFFSYHQLALANFSCTCIFLIINLHLRISAALVFSLSSICTCEFQLHLYFFFLSSTCTCEIHLHLYFSYHQQNLHLRISAALVFFFFLIINLHLRISAALV